MGLPSESGQDRRTFPRTKPRIPLYVDLPERRVVRDISLSGAFIEGKPLLAPAERIQLRFWLGVIKPVVVNARIRRIEEGQGMGVEFLTLNEDDYARLRQFLEIIPRMG